MGVRVRNSPLARMVKEELLQASNLKVSEDEFDRALNYVIKETYNVYKANLRMFKKEFGIAYELVSGELFSNIVHDLVVYKTRGFEGWWRKLPPVPRAPLPSPKIVSLREGQRPKKCRPLVLIPYPAYSVVDYLFAGKEPDPERSFKRFLKFAGEIDPDAYEGRLYSLVNYLRVAKNSVMDFLEHPECYRTVRMSKQITPKTVKTLVIEVGDVVEVLVARLKFNKLAEDFVKRFGKFEAKLGKRAYYDYVYDFNTYTPVLVVSRDTDYQEYLFNKAFGDLKLWDWESKSLRGAGVIRVIPPEGRARKGKKGK